jgi:hypothetical protein
MFRFPQQSSVYFWAELGACKRQPSTRAVTHLILTDQATSNHWNSAVKRHVQLLTHGCAEADIAKLWERISCACRKWCKMSRSRDRPPDVARDLSQIAKAAYVISVADDNRPANTSIFGVEPVRFDRAAQVETLNQALAMHRQAWRACIPATTTPKGRTISTFRCTSLCRSL